MSALATPRAHHACFDCRVYERLECELPVACQPAAAFGREETRWPGTVRDVSQGGLRLTLERRYEPGTGLAIELPQDAHGETRTVLLKVIHIRRQPDGLWSLGCKFISELGEDEVRRLLPRLASNAADANECHDEPHTVAGVRLQVSLASGVIVDFVASQVIVPPSWPLACGKTVTLMGGKASGTPWKLHLRVVHCEQHPGGWVLRGELLQAPLATALLRALGSVSEPEA
jgi:hypothetical protein